MIPVGPVLAQELFDRIESEILGPDQAPADDPAGAGRRAQVPASPEPPD